MPSITNNGRESLDFVVKGGKVTDGVPESVSLAAGETRDINTDLDSAQNKGRLHAELISVSGRETRAPRAPKE